MFVIDSLIFDTVYENMKKVRKDMYSIFFFLNSCQVKFLRLTVKMMTYKTAVDNDTVKCSNIYHNYNLLPKTCFAGKVLLPRGNKIFE